MLLDALNLTTGSFTALDADASQEVFETLITVGDRVRDSDRDRLPLPPSGLIADVYGETILSCLRGDGFDLALVRDRLEDYDVEDICRDSRWVGERELLNTRQSVGRLVASLRAEDDTGKRGMLLSGYRAPALILADLGAYVRSVIEALGPSFLETVAEDVAQGDYEPLAETVDGRPTGLLVPDDAREAAQLTAAAATATAAAAAGRKRSRVVELARAAGPGSGGAGPSSRGKGKAPASNPAPDETAAPIARSKAAKAKLARANASVPDPLAAALAASGRDASGAGPSSRGGAAAMWMTLNRHLDDEAAEETETEEAEEVEGDDDSNGEPSPAAVAARRRKMNITAHRKPNATTVAWDEDDEDEDAEEDAREGAGGAGAEGARGAKRRYNRWSKDEIEALKGLVGEFGVGNWQDITREGKRRGEFKEHLHPNTVREKWYYVSKKATRK